MLTIAFPAAAFATNCYVLATGPGEECLVVDPGIGVEDRLAEVCRENGLRPAAVLLTHGHLDHVYAVTPVCGGDTAASLPAYIHGDDRYRLENPLASMDAGLLAMLSRSSDGGPPGPSRRTSSTWSRVRSSASRDWRSPSPMPPGIPRGR